MTGFLLDTCAVIWTARGEPLREPAATTSPAHSITRPDLI